MDDVDAMTRQRVLTALLTATVEISRGDVVGESIRRLGVQLRELLPPAPQTGLVRRETPTQVVVAQPVQAAPVTGPSRQQAEQRATVIRLFDAWRTQLDHPQAKLTPDRAQKVVGRLREGYTEADIMAAIDGCANSPFHRGENDAGTRYDDLTLICRSGSVLEKFRDLAGHQAPTATVEIKPPDPAQVAEEREIRRLEFEAKAMLKAGRTAEYNDAIRSIRARKVDPSVGR